jgi:hypothetical protein
VGPISQRRADRLKSTSQGPSPKGKPQPAIKPPIDQAAANNARVLLRRLAPLPRDRSAPEMSSLEYVVEVAVVPRVCELCNGHLAVVYWAGSWPTFYACRCCWEAWAPLGAQQPWVRPIGWAQLEDPK